MLKVFRVRAALASLVVVAALVPIAGRAVGSCSAKTVLFSFPASVNSNVGVCAVKATEGKYDGRLINPGSDQISVRYIGAVKYKPASVSGYLNGVGFSNKKLVLVYTDISPAGDGSSYGYETGLITLPKDIASSGCLHVRVLYRRVISGKTVTILDERTDWHTADAAC